MSNNKISIRFFDDREVRTVWDEENSKWWFSVFFGTDKLMFTQTIRFFAKLKLFQ